MAISVGDKVPDVKLMTMTAEGPRRCRAARCSARAGSCCSRCPGRSRRRARPPPARLRAAGDDIRAKGVDTVACVAVNDPFVMGAWGQVQNTEAR